MVSTRGDYKRKGKELLSGIEQRRVSRMAGEHYEGDEEEDPRDKLDCFEWSLATLTSMVLYLLEEKRKETNTCHEGSNKEEKKTETTCNTEP